MGLGSGAGVLSVWFWRVSFSGVYTFFAFLHVAKKTYFSGGEIYCAQEQCRVFWVYRQGLGDGVKSYQPSMISLRVSRKGFFRGSCSGVPCWGCS